MPRTPAKPPTRTPKANLARTYRSSTKGVAPSKATPALDPYVSLPDAIHFAIPQTTTLVSPVETADTLWADDTSLPHSEDFSSKQVYLLQLYIRYPGDGIKDALKLCQQAGYHATTDDGAKALVRRIIQRVEAIGDTRRMMQLAGMGNLQWTKKIFAIANCGSARVEVIAAKLWGLAVGAFDDPVPSSGAKIIIEAGAQGDSGSSAVRVTLEGAGAASKDSDGTVSFSTTKPTSRKKLLRSLS